jgi:hypothetical protein
MPGDPSTALAPFDLILLTCFAPTPLHPYPPAPKRSVVPTMN